jgi:hypothetical protein
VYSTISLSKSAGGSNVTDSVKDSSLAALCPTPDICLMISMLPLLPPCQQHATMEFLDLAS